MPVAVCDCTYEKKEVRSLPSQRFYISEHRENDLALTRSENEVNTTSDEQHMKFYTVFNYLTKNWDTMQKQSVKSKVYAVSLPF